MLGVCLKYEQKNYGSKLQALATVKGFENLKVDYEIIRYNKKDLRFIIKSIPRIFNFTFINDRYLEIQRKSAFKKHPEIAKKVAMRNKAFDEFDRYFENKLSPLYKSYTDLKKSCKTAYSKVITCSDQLWSPSALASNFYNLNFAPDEVEKISWSSSFGVGKIPWYQITRTKKYLNRIENITMRENKGAEIVEQLTGRKVPVLMDPVFSLTKAEWQDLVPCSPPEFDNYIFCYFLGNNPHHRQVAKELADKTGLKIVTLRHLDYFTKTDENFGDYAPYDVDPQRFLNILRNAKYVLTDSFHGMAFSVICEKQFLVFDRYNKNSKNSKNSRIESVCENLNLQERHFDLNDDITEIITKPIDYTAVLKMVEEYRQKTKDYLKTTLNNNA
jgi:hypothetical protein